ncbi:MAG: ribosome biogenesis GTP-binding protein YihA/YsxC [Mariprofundales bacterium]|nr:ribosome biogenesis GTP-binding protein YihA/YsxC [Mariprofundales bacterium]
MDADALQWPHTNFVMSVAQLAQFPALGMPSVAVAGHSNVGKSSLLNALFGRKGLVKTSKNPGCTRLLNLFAVDERLLVVDLPGYGFARASKGEQARWGALISSYLRSASAPKRVLMLLDIRHGPKPHDLQLISWLDAAAIRWIPVATKADKLSGNQRGARLREMTAVLGSGRVPLPTSASKGMGIRELRTMVQQEVLAEHSDESAHGSDVWNSCTTR